MTTTTAKNGTAIEWTHVPGYKGETWNPVTGCDRISPGCAHCYARTMARRLKAMGQPSYQHDGDGPGFGVSVHPDKLREPFSWRKPRAVFVNSMSDVFHDEIPDRFIAEVYDTMRLHPQHIFMVLTKRPERARDWYLKWKAAFDRFTTSSWPLPNVWLGVSIENSRFTWRADVLREIPAAVRFISAEPLLGSLFEDARSPRPPSSTLEERQHARAPLNLDAIDWLIVGGESGHDARPMHPDWARELRDACLAENLRRDPNGLDQAGPAFFFKQHGAWAPYAWKVGDSSSRLKLHSFRSGNRNVYVQRVGKNHAGRVLDGRTWDEFPTGAA